MAQDIAKLTDVQDQYVDLMVEGHSTAEIIRRLGIPSSTGYKWRHSEVILKEFKLRMVGKMSEHAPALLASMVNKALDDKSSLMGTAKAFELVADRTGLTPSVDEHEKVSLGITIDLGDGPVAPQEIFNQPDIAEENKRLKAEVETLKARLNAPVVEVDPEPPEAG